MRLPIRLLPNALIDVEESRAWYEKQRDGLGGLFMSKLRDTMSTIAIRPFTFMSVMKRVRRAQVAQFPYYVYFTVLDDEIYVLAIMHARRNPSKWQRRKI